MRNAKGQFLDGNDGKENRFRPGEKPWNAGLKGYMGPNSTSFKKGQEPASAKAKGYIGRQMKYGKLEKMTINIDWKGDRKPNNTYAWYVWEVEHQQDRPEGMCIYHMDGDKENNHITNLEVITRAELARRNKGGWSVY